MKIRPGRTLVCIAVALLLPACLAFYWPNAAWLPVLALPPLLVLIALDHRSLRAGFQQVRVERTLPPATGRNVAFRVELRISNAGRRPRVGTLRDAVPAAAVPAWHAAPFVLPGGGGVKIAAEFRIPQRGEFQFGPVWVRLAGWFGLLEAQLAFDCMGRVRVLPEGFSGSETFRHNAQAEMILLDKASRARQVGAGTEFEMLSEFRPGDDPRRIDWKSTARRRAPVVRRFKIERHRDVMLVIDCGRLMGADAGRGSKLDCAVDAALMLCRTALAGGDRCGAALFDDHVLGFLPPVSGPRALRTIVDSVYNVQSRWRESDFGLMFATLQARQTRRALIVVLSDIVDAETTQRFRTSLATLARRHIVLFAGLQSPELRQIVSKPAVSLRAGAEMAVAFRLLREREAALHALNRSGVQVLDVEPGQLTVPLINRFLEVRRQNRL